MPLSRSVPRQFCRPPTHVSVYCFFCLLGVILYKLGALLANLRQPSSRSEDEPTAAILTKARARGSAAQTGRVFDVLLRALGARGRGPDLKDLEERRAYGLSLLKVIEEVAAQAQVSGKHGEGDGKTERGVRHAGKGSRVDGDF